MESMYALVTELKRSRAPQLLQTLRGSCILQLKEAFSRVPKDTQAAALAYLVRLLLDHCPDTPEFELVLCNLVEDVCFGHAIATPERQEAKTVCMSHTNPLAKSLCFSLTHPWFDTFRDST
jgi:hypothetical protein